MIKKITTKLVLKKETISNFEMNEINGGVPYTYTLAINCTRWASCRISICCAPE